MGRLIDQYIRNAEEREWAYKIDALAAGFAERAAAHDLQGSFPHENFAELQAAGYLKLTVPKEFGGDEASLHELVGLQERLAYGDGSTALAVGWHIGQVLHLRTTRKWPEQQFEKLCQAIVQEGAMINTLASEAGSGSPSRGGKPETAAMREDGGYRITGRKTFSTLSPILDRFVVTAYIPEEETVADFLVYKNEQVSIAETWDTLGMRGTGSHDVILDNVFTAEENRLTGKGTDDGGGWLLHIPACYLGIALAARDFVIHYAKSYRPNHLQGPLAELPAIQQSIGELEAELRVARSLLYEAADRWDAEIDNRPNLRPELGLAKYVATNHAIKVVDIAMRIVGGASLSRKLPLERYYRDVRAGLHNPPMDNMVLQTLASEALKEQ